MTGPGRKTRGYPYWLLRRGIHSGPLSIYIYSMSWYYYIWWGYIFKRGTFFKNNMS